MKKNSILSHTISMSALLFGTTILSSCNKHHMTAMELEQEGNSIASTKSHTTNDLAHYQRLGEVGRNNDRQAIARKIHLNRNKNNMSAMASEQEERWDASTERNKKNEHVHYQRLRVLGRNNNNGTQAKARKPYFSRTGKRSSLKKRVLFGSLALLGLNNKDHMTTMGLEMNEASKAVLCFKKEADFIGLYGPLDEAMRNQAVSPQLLSARKELQGCKKEKKKLSDAQKHWVSQRDELHKKINKLQIENYANKSKHDHCQKDLKDLRLEGEKNQTKYERTLKDLRLEGEKNQTEYERALKDLRLEGEKNQTEYERVVGYPPEEIQKLLTSGNVKHTETGGQAYGGHIVGISGGVFGIVGVIMYMKAKLELSKVKLELSKAGQEVLNAQAEAREAQQTQSTIASGGISRTNRSHGVNSTLSQN